MMKRILLSLLIVLFAVTMSAVPSLRTWRTYTQSDGTKIELMLVGDENFHYFTTTDGIAVMEDHGSYYYADITGRHLQRSNLLAHAPQLRTAEEKAALAQLGNGNDSNLRRIRANAPQLTTPRRVGDPSSYIGSKRGLIILVSFDDLEFQGDDPKAIWTDLANKEGYTNNQGAKGSVHDYFLDQSRGLFDLSFDVVGPYKAPKSVTYYGENNNRGGDQWQRVIELLKFACESADEDVNYKDYDWDGDGEVDQVFMLYAGMGEASGGESYTIWPHESQIGKWPVAYRLDNTIINTYACGEELNYYGQLTGIGTFCHEFSHCLGLPDFYDTRANSGTANTNYGMGTWDVMCGGSYNSNSWVPAAYTGYERKFCGWIEYKELTDPCKVSSLAPIAENGDVFCYRNPQHPDEYYLFEHRNNTVGWDRGVASRGLLIYHVNYVADRWHNNTPNNGEAGVECMAAVAADNSRSEYTENGDLFPYTSTIPVRTYNEFSDETTPADILYYPNTDGTKLLHIKLSKITYTKKTKTVSFVFNDGTDEYVDTGIDESTITLFNKGVAGIYDLNGLRMNATEQTLSTLPRGLYIIKSADGSTKKVMVK